MYSSTRSFVVWTSKSFVHWDVACQSMSNAAFFIHSLASIRDSSKVIIITLMKEKCFAFWMHHFMFCFVSVWLKSVIFWWVMHSRNEWKKWDTSLIQWLIFYLMYLNGNVSKTTSTIDWFSVTDNYTFYVRFLMSDVTLSSVRLLSAGSKEFRLVMNMRADVKMQQWIISINTVICRKGRIYVRVYTVLSIWSEVVYIFIYLCNVSLLFSLSLPFNNMLTRVCM